MPLTYNIQKSIKPCFSEFWAISASNYPVALEEKKSTSDSYRVYTPYSKQY